MPKISVLIPIYNVEKYLAECLDSVINQTEKDIEIICVEDCSTDESYRILKSYEDKDNRLKCIYHQKNEGTCKSRKDAVELASSEYIMFVDSDDYIELDACEKLYKIIESEKVDVIQFDASLCYGENVGEEMVNWVSDFMHPEEGIIEGDLLKECFVNRKFNFNLVNKIWKSECCKNANKYIDDSYCTTAEDRYVCFLMLYFAKSYLGLGDKLYNYRLGVGVTGGESLDIQRFEKRCSGKLACDKLRDFLNAVDLDAYEEEYTAFEDDILWDCVHCWYKKLPEQYQPEGYQVLLKYWDVDRIVGTLARFFFEDQKTIIKKTYSKENKKNVMIYYRYLGYEPMNSILKEYKEQLQLDGSNIIFATDEDANYTGGEFLGCKLIRFFSATEANWDKYERRGKEWAESIKENSINLVIYLSSTSHVMLLDKMVIEGMNVCEFASMDEKSMDYFFNKLLETKKENNDNEMKYKEQIDELRQIETNYNHLTQKKIYKVYKKIKKVLRH